MPTSITPTIVSTGSLGSFVGSGNTSSVYTHDQGGYITYRVVDESSLNADWPTTCKTIKKFKLSYSVAVDEEIFDWNVPPSSTYNETFNCVSAVVNSYDSSTGLGTSGYVHLHGGGYSRLSVSSDYAYHHVSEFNDIIVTSPIGQNSERADDVSTMNAFINRMNTEIRTGGLLYSTTGNSNDTSTTTPEYGWEPRLLCP